MSYILPPDFVNPEIKQTREYAVNYAQAAWNIFGGYTQYNRQTQEYINLRRWGEGLQDTSAFKDYFTLYSKGDVAYEMMDYSSITIVAEKVDRIVKNILNMPFEIRCEAIDKFSLTEKDDVFNDYKAKMLLKDLDQELKQQYGEGLFADNEQIPETEEELDLFASIKLRLAQEIAFEGVLKYTFKNSDEALLKRKTVNDLVVLKTAVHRVVYDDDGVPKIQWQDPVTMVRPWVFDYDSYSDAKYMGYVRYKSIDQIAHESKGQITPKELSAIAEKYKVINPSSQMLAWKPIYYPSFYEHNMSESIPVFELEYLSMDVENFRYWENKAGISKLERVRFGYNIEQDPVVSTMEFSEHIQKVVSRRYVANWIIDTEYAYGYGLAPNQVYVNKNGRPDLSGRLTFNATMPGGYDNQNRSHVSRMMTPAKQMQINALKIQREIAGAIPSGWSFNEGALLNLDLGKGQGGVDTLEVIRKAVKQGVLFHNSVNEDGTSKPVDAAVPFGGLNSAAIAGYLQTYMFFKEQLNEITGGSSVTMTSNPDPKALVGTQKMAAMGTDNSLGTIVDAYVRLMERDAKLATDMVLSIADTKAVNVYGRALGANYAKVISINSDYSLYEIGVFVEYLPDEEQRALMGQLINYLIERDKISASDAFMLQTQAMQSPKIAAYYMREMERQKMKQEAEIAQRNTELNSQQQVASLQAKAQADAMLQQQKTEGQIAIDDNKAQNDLELSIAQHDMKMEENGFMAQNEIDKLSIANESRAVQTT